MPVMGNDDGTLHKDGGDSDAETQQETPLSVSEVEKRKKALLDASEMLVARIHRRRRSGLAGLSSVPTAGDDDHDHDHDPTTMTSSSSSSMPSSSSAAGWGRMGLLSASSIRPPACSILHLANAVAPSFCMREKTLLVCDGSSIALRSFRGGQRGRDAVTDTLLPAPFTAGVPLPSYTSSSLSARFTIRMVGAVTRASLSPSGLFVAAVVDVDVTIASLADSDRRLASSMRRSAWQETAGESARQPAVGDGEGGRVRFGGVDSSMYGEAQTTSSSSTRQSSKEVFVWFHDHASPSGEWVCLGSMGLPLLAAESAIQSTDSTGFISCSGQPGGGGGKSGHAACGVAIDWLPDDTLTLAVSVVQRPLPIKVAPVSAATAAKASRGGGSHGRGGRAASPVVLKKRSYDFLMAALTVTDIFSGGFAPPTATTAAAAPPPLLRSRPTVAVFRDSPYDLLGARCVPLAAANSADNDNSVATAGSTTVAQVFWAGSQLSVVSFPARTKTVPPSAALPPSVTFSSDINTAAGGGVDSSSVYSAMYGNDEGKDDKDAQTPVIPPPIVFVSVIPLFADDIGVRGPFLGVDLVTLDHGVQAVAKAVGPTISGSEASLPSDDAAPPSTDDKSFDVTMASIMSTTIASLDSFGNVKVALLPHHALLVRPNKASAKSSSRSSHRNSYGGKSSVMAASTSSAAATLPLRSAYARMPSGCSAIGTLRTIALIGRPAPTRGAGQPSFCLALGSSTSVPLRVFSLTLLTQEPEPLSGDLAFALEPAATGSLPPLLCHLTLLYKASAAFVPDHILPLPLLPALVYDADGASSSSSSLFPGDDDGDVDEEAFSSNKENEGGRAGSGKKARSMSNRDKGGCFGKHWTPDLLLLGKGGGMAFIPSRCTTTTTTT